MGIKKKISNIRENNLTFYIELDMKELLCYKNFDIPIHLYLEVFN